VALSQQRGKVSFGADTNLNSVYADLLEAVFERQYEGRRHAALEPIGFADFESLLEEIALAIWHGSGRTATDAEIARRCEQGRLASRLAVFRQGAEKGRLRMRLLTPVAHGSPPRMPPFPRPLLVAAARPDVPAG
jgi:hypothetical protein